MFRIAVDGRELTHGICTGIGRYLVEVLRAASEAAWECLVYGNSATPLPVAFPRAREFSPERTPGRVLALLRAVSEAARQT